MDDVGQTLLNWASAFGTQEMVRVFCNVWHSTVVLEEIAFRQWLMETSANKQMTSKGCWQNLGQQLAYVVQYGYVKRPSWIGKIVMLTDLPPAEVLWLPCVMKTNTTSFSWPSCSGDGLCKWDGLGQCNRWALFSSGCEISCCILAQLRWSFSVREVLMSTEVRGHPHCTMLPVSAGHK